MAGKVEFEQFYEHTKPTEEHIRYLRARSTMFHRQDEAYRISVANVAFGMLAHLNIVNEGDTPFIFSRLPQLGISDFAMQATCFESLERVGVIYGTKVNPTAIPHIRKYRAAFDKYEQAMGIQNPFTKKENGDA